MLSPTFDEGRDDALGINSSQFLSVNAVLLAAAQDGDDVVITATGGTVRLLNVDINDLHEDDVFLI